MADGLVPDDSWTYEGELPLVWRDRLMPAFQEYVTGSCSPKDQEPFITLEANDTTPHVPLYLEPQESLIQEFMQAMFEIDGRELPLYLGFQFKDRTGNWRKIEGEMSFASLNFVSAIFLNSFITFPNTFFSSGGMALKASNKSFTIPFLLKNFNRKFSNSSALLIAVC